MKKSAIPGLPTPEASKAYKLAIQAAEKTPEDFLALGRHMRTLEELDKSLLAQFMKHAPGIKASKRRPYYWLSIVKKFDGLGVTDEKLREVGWTKLQELTEYVDRVNVYDLLDKAKDFNVRQLKAKLTNNLALVETKAVTLYFDKKQKNIFEELMNMYGAVALPGGGHTQREVALIKAIQDLFKLQGKPSAKAAFENGHHTL